MASGIDLIEREKHLAKLTEAAVIGYPAFVRAAWIQPTIDDRRSQTIAVLGLMGEVGEVCEIIKKRVRGDAGAHVSDEKLLMELGDVWFYFNLMRLQWGFSHEPDITPNPHWVDADRCVALIQGVGGLNGWIAAAMSNSQIGLNRGQVREIRPHVAAIVGAIEGICFAKDIAIRDIEVANIKKLTDRIRNTGTLRGSGSDR